VTVRINERHGTMSDYSSPYKDMGINATARPGRIAHNTGKWATVREIGQGRIKARKSRPLCHTCPRHPCLNNTYWNCTRKQEIK